MKLFLPVKIYMEKNAVASHGHELSSLGTKAMIVTGRKSSKINGSLTDTEKVLKGNNVPYVIFDEIEENPSVATVVNAAGKAIEENVDFFIGIGGGSPMDAAKVISLMAMNPELMINADEALYTSGKSYKGYPIAEIPTTSGTGSEVTQYAILTRHEKRTKKSISHHIFADLALVDWNYLKSSKPEGLRSTCIDALAHLIESYLNTNSSELNRVYSAEGIRVWGSVKEKLVSEDKINEMSDADYETFMRASVLGGMAIAHTGTSLPHGLSYPLTYEMGIPHGRALGIFLPAFLRYYENKDDVNRILAFLGMNNVDEFDAYIRSVLGKVDISDELWKSDVESIMANPAKLKNYPGTMTAGILEKFRP